MTRHLRTHGALPLLLSFVSAASAFAHGEHAPGPHQGLIRMPGPYHLELVNKGSTPTGFEVFVLDVSFKNPTVGDGVSLSAKRVREKSEPLAIACTPAQDRFACALPDEETLRPGDRVEIDSAYKGKSGKTVSYDYPFVLPHPAKAPGSKPAAHP